MAIRMPASIRYYDREGRLLSLISEPRPWEVEFSDCNNNYPPKGAGYRVMVYAKMRPRPVPLKKFTGHSASLSWQNY